MPTPEHLAHRVESVRCGVVTVSDTRTAATDKSGLLIRELLDTAGHRVEACEIVRDDVAAIRAVVSQLCGRGTCHAVILTGGSGIAARDNTPEAVEPLFVRRMDGFGELFRMLSYDDVGAAAMLSRATAGVCGSTMVFVLPGSVAAVRLAMEKLILPQIAHIAGLLGEGSS